MDIWQAGIVWVNFLYAPCPWRSSGVLRVRSPNAHQEYWRALIHTLGGNTMIPINATAWVDLRIFANLPTSVDIKVPSPSEFQPLLGKCSSSSHHVIPYLKDSSVPAADKELAVDLVLKMMRISPTDRPTAREVLQHPFFRLFPDQSNEAGNAQ